MILKRVNTETLLSAHSNRWALRFFAWNYVTFTFLVRPFSNSLETLVLALVTLLSMELLLRRNPLRSSALLLSLLGSTCAFGCFVRMTFPAFGTPLVVLVLWKALRRRHVLKALLWFLVGAALMTIIGVLTDSLYFQSLNWQHIRDLSITLNQLTLTPWNNLRYNMNVDNLSQHGIHARWTHVVVNMPLLYLPLLLILAQVLSTSRQLSFLFRPKGLLFLGPILSGLACLSWMPHQEARFLVPLTFSLHGLLALVFSATQEKFQITRKRWTVFYLMFHITLTLLFGVWHQGGIVPCLLSLTDRSSLDFRTTVYFWKVYNPPLSFLGHPLLRSVDLSTGVTEQLRPGSLLITPRWMESSMPFPVQVEWLETCPRQSSWVHLGLDDAQLFFAAAWKAVTMWDWSSLSLGLYRISWYSKQKCRLKTCIFIKKMDWRSRPRTIECPVWLLGARNLPRASTSARIQGYILNKPAAILWISIAHSLRVLYGNRARDHLLSTFDHLKADLAEGYKRPRYPWFGFQYLGLENEDFPVWPTYRVTYRDHRKRWQWVDLEMLHLHYGTVDRRGTVVERSQWWVKHEHNQ